MPPPPPQSGQSDNSMSMLWIVAAVFAVMGGIWYGFHPQIIYFYLTLKIVEVSFLTALSKQLNFDTAYATFDQLHSILEYARANASQVSYKDLINLGDRVGVWLRIPFAVLLFLLGIIVYAGNSTRIYRRTYSMQELARLEKDNWPQISPVLNLDLLQTDIDTGPWAMAMTPMQFCKRYHLLDEVKPQRREGMSRKDWDRIDVVLKRGETNKLFALQLGPLWRGYDKLPPYMRALFAIFAARINEDTSSAQQLILQLNRSCTRSSLNISGADALAKKHIGSKLVQKILQSHAYVLTVMAAMLEGARSDGVQASADFLWLKQLDRRLWYILNSVGRQTPFVEVGGVFAHWVAEKEAGRKLIVPMIEEATNAVELALKDVLYKRDEQP